MPAMRSRFIARMTSVGEPGRPVTGSACERHSRSRSDYRRRWSGCGTCCSPDNTGDNNSVREITGGALQRLDQIRRRGLWATWPTRGLTGIDSPCLPAVGVRAEVRAKKPPRAARAGILDGGGFIASYALTPRFVSRPPTFAPVAPPPGAKIPGPPTAKAICGLTIVCTLTPTSNNPPDTVSSSVSISSHS